MAAGPRVTLQPIPFNLNPAGPGLFITATTPGYDLGSPSAITAWSGQLGVQIPNNGQVILGFACGATAAGAFQVLVGDQVGNTGQVLPATTVAGTIAANTVGWLGPWSPATYNIQNSSVSFTGDINTQALTASAVGTVVIDFTTTTTLALRAYQLIPVQP